jgi:hypothetical protein
MFTDVIRKDRSLSHLETKPTISGRRSMTDIKSEGSDLVWSDALHFQWPPTRKEMLMFSILVLVVLIIFIGAVLIGR